MAAFSGEAVPCSIVGSSDYKHTLARWGMEIRELLSCFGCMRSKLKFAWANKRESWNLPSNGLVQVWNFCSVLDNSRGGRQSTIREHTGGRVPYGSDCARWPYRSFAVCPIWKPSSGRQLCPDSTGSRGRLSNVSFYTYFFQTLCVQ